MGRSFTRLYETQQPAPKVPRIVMLACRPLVDGHSLPVRFHRVRRLSGSRPKSPATVGFFGLLRNSAHNARPLETPD